MVKNLPANAGDMGQEDSPGEGNGSEFQYSLKISWSEESGGLWSRGSQKGWT